VPRRKHNHDLRPNKDLNDHACECELVAGHPGQCWCGGCDYEFAARLHGRRVYMHSHDAGLAEWDDDLKAFVARG
jgi:hypothetical protein